MLSPVTLPQAAGLFSWRKKKKEESELPPPMTGGFLPSFEPKSGSPGPFIGMMNPMPVGTAPGTNFKSLKNPYTGLIGVGAAAAAMSVGTAVTGGMAGAAVGAIGSMMGAFKPNFAMPVPAAPAGPTPEEEVHRLATAFDDGQEQIGEKGGFLMIGGTRLKRRMAT